jgi:hypothetical protein
VQRQQIPYQDGPTLRLLAASPATSRQDSLAFMRHVPATNHPAQFIRNTLYILKTKGGRRCIDGGKCR